MTPTICEKSKLEGVQNPLKLVRMMLTVTTKLSTIIKYTKVSINLLHKQNLNSPRWLSTKYSTWHWCLQTVTEQLRVTGGDRGVLRGEEFKRYVTKLRARSSVYKRQRAELAQVKAEGGVLARTLDILKTRLNELGTDEVSQPIRVNWEIIIL